MKMRRGLACLVLLLLFATGVARQGTSAQAPADRPDGRVVVRLYFEDRQHLDAVAGGIDIWEVQTQAGYAVALVSPSEYRRLAAAGYRLEIDEPKTALAGIQAPLDPRFYYFDSYYPNPGGLHIVNKLQEVNASYPTLTELFDTGDAWLAGVPGEHDRDIWVLRITNEDPAFGAIEDKPVFFLFATIHAREVTTPELVMRYILYLTGGYNGEGGYGVDPDATWLVDHNVLYALVMQNPDGHWVDEADSSAYWRKNLDNDDGCTEPLSWGIDLNRNHSFLWGCCGGSSSDPCSGTYRGPSGGSEPETQAFQTFFTSVVPDQNGPNGDDQVPPAAPDDATGIFISLHSYSDVVLWPWYLPGYPPAPNEAQIETIGRKLAYYNGFEPTGTIGYTVDGATDYWTYGKFGVASYTFEVGSGSGECGGFFPAYGCIDGIDGASRNFWAENKPAFLYAHKIARTPYMTAYGPDAEAVAAIPTAVAPGGAVEITAEIADHRYTGDPLQPIVSAEYFVDSPGQDGTGTALAPSDGSWGGMTEAVAATLDTSGLPLGRHLILVHGRNDDGDWGPFTATFLYIMQPGVSPVIKGYVRDASTNAPLAASVKAGIFQTQTDPQTGFYSMMLIGGTYDMTVASPGYVVATAEDVEVHDYEQLRKDFFLYTYCDIFTDDVEAGNPGWIATPPWAITTEAAHSPDHSWTDSPGSNYGSNVNVSLTSPVFDLSDDATIGLSFWHIYDIQYMWDWGYVEYSTDGGSTWLQAAAYSNDQQLTWANESIELPALDHQPNARVRFRLWTSPWVQQDGWHIDDIVLSGGGPACVIPMTPSAEFTSNSPVELGEPVQFANQTLGTPPLAYQWDFGDGVGSSTEENPDYTYSSPGTYSVTLVATNAHGSDAVSHSVQVLPAAASMHVGGIKMRYQDLGGRYRVYANVRVVDQGNQAVGGAVVSVEWTLPNGSVVTQEAISNAKGVAAFRVRSTQVGAHGVCVTDVTKVGWSYDPDQNQVTCDSLDIP